MASGSTNNTNRAGLSLYANLLGPENPQASLPGTISRAPVVFRQPDGGPDQDDGDVSALRPQPSSGIYEKPLSVKPRQHWLTNPFLSLRSNSVTAISTN